MRENLSETSSGQADLEKKLKFGYLKNIQILILSSGLFVNN